MAHMQYHDIVGDNRIEDEIGISRKGQYPDTRLIGFPAEKREVS
jgi:hypothetical protein